MPSTSNCTYKYRQKLEPSPSVPSKNLQKSPYWKLLAAPIENSQGAYFQQKRKNNTGFKQTEKKKKNLPTPSKPTYQETRRIKRSRPRDLLSPVQRALPRKKMRFFEQPANTYPKYRNETHTIRLSLLRFARIPHQTKAGEARVNAASVFDI